MAEHAPDIASAEIPSTRQRLFIRYLMAVLIDLTVLNLFVEYWHHVVIDSFTVSLMAAVLLQVLLRLTLLLEHRVAAWFNTKQGAFMRFMRYFAAWFILFSSKFVILWAVDLAFGDDVLFGGPVHGVVAFIAVVMAMLAAEEIVLRIYRRL